MRKWLAGVMLVACLVSPAMAADQVPSDASLHQLLDALHTRAQVDGVLAKAAERIHSGVLAGLGNTTPDAAQWKMLQEGERRMVELLKRELTWEQVEPIYLDVYRKRFSQQEVNDMIAFYKSPSGQALLIKMPLATQDATQMEAEKMRSLQPELTKIGQETISQLKAYTASKSGAPAPDSMAAHD
ncbi:DUF2059 domain-containing protein [Dyella soli]|nr:DUF2059 domain-containing protein [Dyella soli]